MTIMTNIIINLQDLLTLFGGSSIELINSSFDYISLIYNFSIIIISELYKINYLDIVDIGLTSIFIISREIKKGIELGGRIITIGVLSAAITIKYKIAGSRQSSTGSTGSKVVSTTRVTLPQEPPQLQPPLPKVVLQNKLKEINKFFIYLKVNLNNLVFSIREKYLFSLNSSIKVHHSFVLPLILSKLELGDGIGQGDIPVIKSYYLAVFILSLIGLLCFLNILGYFLSLYFIQKYNLDKKYPKLKYIIKYYEGSGLLFVILESIICIVALLILSVSGLLLYYKDLG